MATSALDPYTRLLASFADSVTKMRRSLPTSIVGRLAASLVGLSLLGLSGLLLLLSSVVWAPVLCAGVALFLAVSATRSLHAGSVAAAARASEWVQARVHAALHPPLT
eukprot:CAMPEP_0181346358 /NCGR_PEP_ID=MMETSP1101-20121128/33284_1 /TAXON_ID=46948 /ORGANISM="Rhodomonas abbreviata, Strain Caron Lab Isolate" /LENGTH=107 /DNA_ID=CAMNT_0023458463 /DNA_START=311 /DNA_END=630 /DNA_ORIENTATION=+